MLTLDVQRILDLDLMTTTTIASYGKKNEIEEEKIKHIKLKRMSRLMFANKIQWIKSSAAGKLLLIYERADQAVEQITKNVKTIKLK